MPNLKHKEEYNLLLLLSLFLFLPLSSFSQNLDTLLSVGKQKLHFNIQKGEGIPILFESGGGNDGSIWNPLLEPLHEITGTTLITYDRAGYGQSSLNPDLPDKEKGFIEPGIESLFTGLQKLGYDEEVILVAHSYGGFYAVNFAAKYPNRVKAIILIDVNLKSFWTNQFLEQKRAEFTPEWLDYVKSLSPGLYYECLSLEQTVKHVRQFDFPKHIPIIDIVAENPPEFEQESDRERWKARHLEFAAKNEQVDGVLANDCSHYLHYDNPALAINSIVKLYAQVDPTSSSKDILSKSLQYNLEQSNSYREQEYEYWHSERDLNRWGYEFLEEKALENALAIFKLNTLLFPNSANVYDSYGEALLSADRKSEAQKMYQKALELDPTNEHAKEVLHELQKN